MVPHKTTGGAFGTISVQRGSAILEVTTLRKDGTYSVGVHLVFLLHIVQCIAATLIVI